MSRPDFIVYTPENNSHFIVHELSEGSIHNQSIERMGFLAYETNVVDIK